MCQSANTAARCRNADTKNNQSKSSSQSIIHPSCNTVRGTFKKGRNQKLQPVAMPSAATQWMYTQ